MHHLRKRIAAINLTTDKPLVLTKQIKDACFKQQWVVHAKKPFSGINSVVEYLGKYTHKVAISNRRITAVDTIKDTITFSYKDYRSAGSKKQLTLNAMEFIRRFSLHILPTCVRLSLRHHYNFSACG